MTVLLRAPVTFAVEGNTDTSCYRVRHVPQYGLQCSFFFVMGQQLVDLELDSTNIPEKRLR